MATKYEKHPIKGKNGAFVIKGTKKAGDVAESWMTITENLNKPLDGQKASSREVGKETDDNVSRSR